MDTEAVTGTEVFTAGMIYTVWVLEIFTPGYYGYARLDSANYGSGYGHDRHGVYQNGPGTGNISGSRRGEYSYGGLYSAAYGQGYSSDKHGVYRYGPGTGDTYRGQCTLRPAVADKATVDMPIPTIHLKVTETAIIIKLLPRIYAIIYKY